MQNLSITTPHIHHVAAARLTKTLLCSLFGLCVLCNSGCDSINTETVSDGSNENNSVAINEKSTSDRTMDEGGSDKPSAQTKAAQINTPTHDDASNLAISNTSSSNASLSNAPSSSPYASIDDIDALLPATVVNIDSDIQQIKPQLYTATSEHCRNSEPLDTHDCQYAKLHTLSFEPSAPWLDEVIWHNVAVIMRPQLLLEDMHEVELGEPEALDAPNINNKMQKLVMYMLDDIKHGDKANKKLPLAQLMAMEFKVNDPTLSKNHTAYLTIHSAQKLNDSLPTLYYERIIMLDMSNEKPLQLADILKRPTSYSTLLEILQKTDKQYPIVAQAEDVDERWPLHLAQQWYLSEDGLHFVYQPGEMISDASPIDNKHNDYLIDVMIPPYVINTLLKPEYQIQSDMNNITNNIANNATHIDNKRQSALAINDKVMGNSNIKVTFKAINVDEMMQSLPDMSPNTNLSTSNSVAHDAHL